MGSRTKKKTGSDPSKINRAKASEEASAGKSTERQDDATQQIVAAAATAGHGGEEGKAVVENKKKRHAAPPPIKLPVHAKAQVEWLKDYEEAFFATNNFVLNDTSRNIVAIRACMAFQEIRCVYNKERPWVREIMNASPRIAFVEGVGQFPLIICEGFHKDRVTYGEGIDPQTGKPMSNSNKRASTVHRTQHVRFPVAKRLGAISTTSEGDGRATFILYGTAAAMSKIALLLRETEFVEKKAREESQSLAMSLIPRFMRTSPEVRQDKIAGEFHALPGDKKRELTALFKEKKSFIDGLACARAQLNDKEAEALRAEFADIMFMPLDQMIKFDEDVEARQLSLRFKTPRNSKFMEVSDFHSLVQRHVANDKELTDFCTYTNYCNVTITMSQKVTKSMINDLRQKLNAEAKKLDVAGSFWLIPHADEIPSGSAAALHELKRTVPKPNSNKKGWGPPPPTAIRRSVGVSRPISVAAMQQACGELGCSVVAEQEADFSVGIIRWCVEFESVEAFEKADVEGQAFSVMIDGEETTIQVFPPTISRV